MGKGVYQTLFKNTFRYPIVLYVALPPQQYTLRLAFALANALPHDTGSLMPRQKPYHQKSVLYQSLQKQRNELLRYRKSFQVLCQRIKHFRF